MKHSCQGLSGTGTGHRPSRRVAVNKTANSALKITLYIAEACSCSSAASCLRAANRLQRVSEELSQRFYLHSEKSTTQRCCASVSESQTLLKLRNYTAEAASAFTDLQLSKAK